MEKYSQASYGIGWQISNESHAEPVCTYRPNWFARVFLRRKPRYMTIDEISKRLSDAARAAEDQLIRDVFEDGHQTGPPG